LMGVDETIERLGLEVGESQKAACRALEAQGLRFCIDFGYENAERIWNGLNAFYLTPEDIEFLSACGIGGRGKGET
jgi:hypothetical protein